MAPALDGDRLLVGVPSSQSAFLYRWDSSAGRWAFDQEIAPAAPQEQSFFGSSVALSGGRAIVGACTYDVDLDGDGAPDVVDAGTAYVFELHQGIWEETARLQHPEPREADVFGGTIGGVSLAPTHAAVGMLINSRIGGRPGLPGTNAGSAVVYAVPR